MIISGKKAVLVKTESAPSVVCSGCLKKGTTNINVLSQHFHIYWIPLFPIGKIGVSQCRDCSYTCEESNMPDDVRAEYGAVKNAAKPRLWQFSGLALIAILIAWGTFQSGNASKQRDQYVLSPAAGDVYEYKTDLSAYSTLKVKAIQGDTLVLMPNNLQIDKMTALYKINKAENYSDSTFMIDKAQLKKMYNEKTIFDIHRN
jgi:hypothetical protein